MHKLAKGGMAAAAGPTLLAACNTADQPAVGADRPDVLFFLADDYRWDCLSAVGHPVLRTPNLDRIAAEGARFANAFCVTSLCCPSRASFLTGLYGQANGVTHNGPTGGTIRSDVPTLGQLFQRSGYRTVYIGKWHIGGQDIVQPGWDYWASFFGQGEYVDPVLNINGETQRHRGHMTDLLTELALEQLNRSDRQPICMVISYKAAHSPCIPLERYASTHANAAVPEPVAFDEDLSAKPAYVGERAEYREKRGELHGRRDDDSAARFERRAGRVRKYYGCIAGIEDSVGRILSLLERQHRLDNTIVVFAGDNGLLLGDHQLVGKRSAYESSIRIPFLIRFPELVPAVRVIRQTALNVDLLPTLLQACGIEYGGTLHGRSLLPAFAGTDAVHPGGFLYSYWQDAVKRVTPSMRAYRTPCAKYIHHLREDETDELYDLTADPNEMVNLADDPAFAELKKDLQRRMLERMRAIGDDMFDRVKKELKLI